MKPIVSPDAAAAHQQSSNAAPERIVNWEKATFFWGPRHESVWIDVLTLDRMLQQRVGFAGEGGTLGKYAGVDEFMRMRRAKKLIRIKLQIKPSSENPALTVVSIYDGRHRFAWMRDHGAQALPVAVQKSEAAEVARLVGTEARICHVTMLKIPEWSTRMR